MSLGLPDVLLITDAALFEADPGLVEITRQALEGAPAGRVAVQLRLPERSAREIIDIGRSLRELTREAGALLLINRRPDLALVLEADGVHLPEAGMDVGDARRLLGEDAWIGRSCHDRHGLERAAREGASYATLSPVFTVPGKGEALGVDGFRAIRAGVGLPVFALGGMAPENAPEMISAGAEGLALIRGVYRSENPAAAISDILRSLDTMRTRRG